MRQKRLVTGILRPSENVRPNVVDALTPLLEGTRHSAYIRHIEIGTVSLPASSRCMYVK